MNINSSSQIFQKEFSIYEVNFNEKRERSKEYYQTLDKVTSVATIIGGVAGLASFIAGSTSLYLSLSPNQMGYSRPQMLLMLCIFSLLVAPVAWVGAGILTTAAGGAAGYGLTRLAGKVLASIKKIDYFSPKMTDYQFSQQNPILKAQRDNLEKLFQAKHYDREMVVAEKVNIFAKECQPLYLQFRADPELNKIFNPLVKLASFSQDSFCENLHKMSNAELKEKYDTYQTSIEQKERQLENAKNQLQAFLNKKISVIKGFSTEYAA